MMSLQCCDHAVTTSINKNANIVRQLPLIFLWSTTLCYCILVYVHMLSAVVFTHTDISGFVILMMMCMSMLNNSVICYRNTITMSHIILDDGRTKQDVEKIL